MNALGVFQQSVAAFALHALWQTPLLAGAAWLAIRVGRPHVRTAHTLWTATLALCVLVPVAATVAGRSAALQAAREAQVTITYTALDYTGPLPALQRQPAWQRLLRRHFTSSGVQPFAFALGSRAAAIITALYLGVAIFFLVRLVLSWRRSALLVRRSSPARLPRNVSAALHRQCHRLHMNEPPVGISGDIAGPALAGVLRPTLLLPAGTAEQMTGNEIDAVLAHELAHLRRRDPVMHAASSLLLVPVAFHPAALWVAHRIQQTREMACDADAAQQLGSSTQYGRALLQVAERATYGPAQPAASTTFKTKFSLTGLGFLGTSLEFFGAGGAMEERMKTLMNNREARGNRVLRAGAGLTLGAVAVMAAAMLQVQPALAGERGQQAAEPIGKVTTDEAPRLIGGDHAREQLRNARRQLDAAAEKATNDEERSKIATARALTSAAEQQIAAASGPGHINVRVDKLDSLKLNLKGLDTLHVDPKVHVNFDQLNADLAQMRIQLNSPEFKHQIEEENRKAFEMQKQLDSPEFKAQIEKARRDAEAFNTPEFREQIRKQVEAARIHREDIRKQAEAQQLSRVDIDRMVADAQAAQAEAMKNFRIRMSADRDHPGQLVARVDAPNLAANTSNSDQPAPMKIPSNVLAGNSLSKINPTYPPEAKEKKIQGVVQLHVLVDENGLVDAVSVISSPDKLLSDSAVEAVKHWTYKPYLLNGAPKAVESTVNVTYSFAD